MSNAGVENVSHTDPNNIEEIALKCEVLTSNSGLDTLDSCSVTFPKSSCVDTVTTDVDKPFNNEETDNESSATLSSPTSFPQEIVDVTNDLVRLDDNLVVKDNVLDQKIADLQPPVEDSLFDIKNESELLESAVKIICMTPSEGSKLGHSIQSLENADKAEVKSNLDLKTSPFENSLQNLASSSMSHNEETNTLINTKTLQKAPYSRSAENISLGNHDPVNNSRENLDAQQILSEFKSQKTKVQATQKIVPEIPEHTQNNLDNRYGRLQKELLNQDLGSIVKNVHGIFSSVSGSLKNAYNISQRGSLSKPAPKVNVSKPIHNNTIMSEIFEEEAVDVKENGIGNHDTHSETANIQNEVLQSTESADAQKEVYKLQVESLERLLAEQRKEMSVLRDRVRQQSEELQEKDQIFKDLEGKMDLMRKTVENAEREKNSAVMRYASSECVVIEARRAADAAVRAEKAALAEVELLGGKLKSAHGEKQRICQLYDDKCHELQCSERELAKTREEQKELEGRLKWTQSKLRTEVEAYKESAERVEKLTQQVSQLEVARDAAAAAAPDALRAKHLESELKESQAALIMSRHEAGDLEKRVTSLTQQLDTCKRERDEAISSLARINEEVTELKESRLRLEEEAASLAGLAAKAALADALGTQLQRESARAQAAEEALSLERARAQTCASREAAALRHVAEVTARHVAEQGRAARAVQEAQALSADNASLRAQQATLEAELTRLQGDLTEETERRNRENRQLARKVAELTGELSEVRQQLEWEKGENALLKRRHASAVKELNRELQKTLKRCDQLEAKLPHNDHENRTGSVSSLSSGESAAPPSVTQNGHASDTLPDIQARSPDRQALIERIVSLQRSLARRSERTEFLEEHCSQLTTELRNKAKLLRGLLCARAEAVNGDLNKKSELARLGYSATSQRGDPLTPELAQQAQDKLQAMLEDTLLTNFTLKENVETLGAEIARLKEQHKLNSSAK